jgi:hypothetical protein
MKTFCVSVSVAVSLLASAGCGSSLGGNCGRVAPCGGDIVGDWTFVDACLSIPGSPLGADCPSAVFEPADLHATGNVSYRADLTFSGTLTLSGSMTFTIPPSCTTIQGVTFTCAQFEQSLRQSMANDPTPTIQSVSCSDSAGCRCVFVMIPQTIPASGTYTTSGTTLQQSTSTTGAQYCVQGSELHISGVDMDMAGMTMSGGYVLKK